MKITKKDLLECYEVGWEIERVKRLKPGYFNRDSGILKILNAIRLMNLNRDKNILDLGCGIGQLAFLLRNKSSRNHILGMDLSEKQIKVAKEIAKKNNIKNIEFLAGDLEKLDIKKLKKFNPDIITLIEVLEHVTNPDKVLRDLKKIMGRDTRVIITVPAPCHNKNNNPYWYLQRVNGKSLGTQDIDEIDKSKKYYKLYHKEYRKREIINLLKKNGFIIESCNGIIFRPIKTKNVWINTLMNRGFISLNLDLILNKITNDGFSRSTIVKARLK